MVEPVNGNKIAALQQTLRQRGMGRVLVIKPGQATFKGVESLKRLPNLYEKLAGFISQKFNIQVVDILSDVDGLLPILAADPSFMERISNSGGNLEVLGHTVVWEMEDKTSGKLYLLKNEDNIKALSIEPAKPITADLSSLIRASYNKLNRIGISDIAKKEKFDLLDLPEDAIEKLAFLTAALEKYMAGVVGPLVLTENHHLLAQLKNMFTSSDASSELVNIGIELALKMIKGDRTDKWAGFTTLSVIPIPKNHPKIKAISDQLAETILNDPNYCVASAAARAAYVHVKKGALPVSLELSITGRIERERETPSAIELVETLNGILSAPSAAPDLSAALQKATAPKPKERLDPKLAREITRLQELCGSLPATETIRLSDITDWNAFKPILDTWKELTTILRNLSNQETFPKNIRDEIGGLLWVVDHDGDHGKIPIRHTITRTIEILDLIRETYDI
jgi:hypothetical protein